MQGCHSRMRELSKENIQGYQLTMTFLLAMFIVIVQVKHYRYFFYILIWFLCLRNRSFLYMRLFINIFVVK